MARTPDVEAVFASNDDMALGALFECHRRGLRVPEDMSIIGFNDLEICAWSYPSLSSVATPRYEMGRQAADIVTRIIRGDGARPDNPIIDLGFEIRHARQHAPALNRLLRPFISLKARRSQLYGPQQQYTGGV